MSDRTYKLRIEGPDSQVLFGVELSLSELEAVLVSLSTTHSMFLDQSKGLEFKESLDSAFLTTKLRSAHLG